MAAKLLGGKRLGRFRCSACAAEFRIRPGAHESAACPACGSVYYHWLDVEAFVVAGAGTGTGAMSDDFQWAENPDGTVTVLDGARIRSYVPSSFWLTATPAKGAAGREQLCERLPTAKDANRRLAALEALGGEYWPGVTFRVLPVRDVP